MPYGVSYTPRQTPITHRKTPSPRVCQKINHSIRSDPALGCPEFDFAAHVRHRSYTMHNFVIDDFEGVALLDEGVERLLPEYFEVPQENPLYTFEIKLAEEKKGLGMFALRDIPAGGLVLVEHPILVFPYVMGVPIPLSEVYGAILNCLPLSAYRAVMSLSNPYPVEECSHIEGLIRANVVGMKLDVPDGPHPELSAHRALFLNVSRCNHSCGPNARWEWDPTTFAVYLSAVRPIRRGEEITVQYISNVMHPRHERQQSLKSSYGFTCRCSYCCLPSTSGSDAARATLHQFWDTLPTFEKWCLSTSMSDDVLIRRHLNALDLIRQEGLEILGCENHERALVKYYGALEDVEMFQYWTKTVRDARVEANPAEAVVFAEWLSDPTSFPFWGWKKEF